MRFGRQSRPRDRSGAADALEQVSIPTLGWWRLRYAVGVGGRRRPDSGSPATHQLRWPNRYCRGTCIRSGGGDRGRSQHVAKDRLQPRSRCHPVAFGAIASATIGSPDRGRSCRAREPSQRTRACGRCDPHIQIDGHPAFHRTCHDCCGQGPRAGPVQDRLGRLGSAAVDPNEGPPRDLSGFQAVEAPAGDSMQTPSSWRCRMDRVCMSRIALTERIEGASRPSEWAHTDTGPLSGWAWTTLATGRIHTSCAPRLACWSPQTAAEGAAWTSSSTRDARPGCSVSGVVCPALPASDPTLLWRDGRYWLFVAVTRHGMSPWDELHLFSAAHLTDVWESSPTESHRGRRATSTPSGPDLHARGRVGPTGTGLLRGIR